MKFGDLVLLSYHPTGSLPINKVGIYLSTSTYWDHNPSYKNKEYGSNWFVAEIITDDGIQVVCQDYLKVIE